MHQNGKRQVMNWYSIMPRLHMSAAVLYSRWNTSGAMYTAAHRGSNMFSRVWQLRRFRNCCSVRSTDQQTYRCTYPLC